MAAKLKGVVQFECAGERVLRRERVASLVSLFGRAVVQRAEQAEMFGRNGGGLLEHALVAHAEVRAVLADGTLVAQGDLAGGEKMRRRLAHEREVTLIVGDAREVSLGELLGDVADARGAVKATRVVGVDFGVDELLENVDRFLRKTFVGHGSSHDERHPRTLASELTFDARWISSVPVAGADRRRDDTTEIVRAEQGTPARRDDDRVGGDTSMRLKMRDRSGDLGNEPFHDARRSSFEDGGVISCGVGVDDGHAAKPVTDVHHPRVGKKEAAARLAPLGERGERRVHPAPPSASCSKVTQGRTFSW